MLFMKESDVGCNLIGGIPVSQRFVVFPDAHSHRPVLSAVVFAGSISFSLSTNTRVHCPLGGFKHNLYLRLWCKSELHSVTLGGAQ